MPKSDIDYSNTIIYKITCKDETISDVYVGHTTNFVQRKHSHKQSCMNPKSSNYTFKLYQVIRANGGWSNWKMDIINFFECKDHYEARKKEQEYFISLNATLNSVEPFPKPKAIIPIIERKNKEIFFCTTCNIYCRNSKLLEDHNKTQKHLKTLDTPLLFKEHSINPKFYKCETCNVATTNKKDYNKHLSTEKHKKLISVNPLLISKPPQHICSVCFKEYGSNVGLWKHKKVCSIKKTNQEIDNIIIENNITENTTENKDKAIIELLIKDNSDFKNIIMEFMKNSSDMQKQLIDVCKNSNNTNTNINNNNNNNNKTFNLQFFLNEQCKDAMNITDFANSFDLQLSDLETVGELGYVNGITKIMVDKLNSMDIYKRPIHCSDAKREIIYVKDQDVWTKEEKDNPKLRQAIKNVSFKNMKLVYNWSNAYPESKDNESKLNDTYMKLVIESTGGNNPILESENKIMRKIAKEIVIEKMHN
jgi:hypothetical protein